MSIATFPIVTPVVRVTALSAFCLVSALILGRTDHALAGPNAGGTLVVHDTGLHFSTVSDLPVPPVTVPPASCPDGVDDNAPDSSPTDMVVWKVYAAFPATSSPRVKGVAWGIVGAAPLYVTTAGLPDPPNCFQVVQGSWPSPPGSIGQSWAFTQTSQFVECYWFGGYGYGGGVFGTAPHQAVDSDFVDDATPGNTDAIAGFSLMGFGVDGHTECPQPLPEYGACCVCYDCYVVTPAECVAMGGTYLGNGTNCSPPVVCVPPPIGACCISYVCTIENPDQCSQMGGTFYGYCTDCDPTPCPPPTPVEESSWGRIKVGFLAR